MNSEYVKKVEKIASVYADKVLEHLNSADADDLEKMTNEIKILYDLTVVQIRANELKENQTCSHSDKS